MKQLDQSVDSRALQRPFRAKLKNPLRSLVGQLDISVGTDDRDGVREAVDRELSGALRADQFGAVRPPKLAEYLADELDAELVPLGSAGAKTMAVVQGHADVYAHSGGQYEWDSAAPVGVAAAAGCHCSRLDGSPLMYNRPDPYLPDLLVCRPELAAIVLAAIRQAPDG